MENYTYQSKFISPEEAEKYGSFTTLPIRVHARDDLANAATDRFIKDWATHIGDGREKTTHFSYSPMGNWAALLIPEAKSDRIGILAALFDLGLVQDDIEETLTIDEADKASKDLSGALNNEDARQIEAGSKSMKLKQLVSEYMLECMTLDRELALDMLDAYRNLWLEIAEDHTRDITNNLTDYRRQRMSNGGMRVFWPMIEFGIGVKISPEQHKLCEPIIEAATTALLYSNDYFSYEREAWELETGQTQRIVSAVEVLMRTQNLSAEDAKAEIKRMIIEAEQDLCKHRDEIYKMYPEEHGLKLWIDCASLGTAGNHLWLASTPRQRAWATGEPPKQMKGVVTKDTKSVSHTNGAVEKADGAEERLAARKDSGYSDDGHSVKAVKPFNSGILTPPAEKQDEVKELSDLALAAPSSYILGMPAKGVRSTFIEALNLWLQVPAEPLRHITGVIDTLHNASLILDDIEDDSPLRRGMPATHKIFGQAQSINSATYMFVHATSLVQKELSSASLAAMLEGLEVLFRGQSWDLYWRQNLICPTKNEYLGMIDQKTGGMFTMLLRLMAAESKGSLPAKMPDLSKMVRLLGRFFQVRDDYMNLVEYSSQKGFGEDLDEGKFSYPVVHCLENPLYRGQILSVFRLRSTSESQNEEQLSTEIKKYLISCLTDSGAMKETLRYLAAVEQELEAEVGKLEQQFGRPNPLLKLCLAKLSMKQYL